MLEIKEMLDCGKTVGKFPENPVAEILGRRVIRPQEVDCLRHIRIVTAVTQNLMEKCLRVPRCRLIRNVSPS